MCRPAPPSAAQSRRVRRAAQDRSKAAEGGTIQYLPSELVKMELDERNMTGVMVVLLVNGYEQ